MTADSWTDDIGRIPIPGGFVLVLPQPFDDPEVEEAANHGDAAGWTSGCVIDSRDGLMASDGNISVWLEVRGVGVSRKVRATIPADFADDPNGLTGKWMCAATGRPAATP